MSRNRELKDVVFMSILIKVGSGASAISYLEVKNDNTFQPRNHDIFNLFVDGVREIGIAGRGRVECHDETMGEILVEAFVVLVGPVFKIEQAVDFPDHALHRVKTFADLFLRDIGFELKNSVVSDHLFAGLVIGLLVVII